MSYIFETEDKNYEDFAIGKLKDYLFRNWL